MPIPSSIKRFIPMRRTLRRWWDTVRPLPALTLQAHQGESAPSPYPSTIDPDNPLEELGRKHRPTKRVHDYLKYYWRHFRDIRHKARAVLEIGVDSGSSLAMWEEFFPNATVHGIDIMPYCKKFEGGRRVVHIGDSSDPEFLRGVLTREPGGFDVVIDDGSHLMEHQLASFNFLFPRLASHGIYAVEDTGGCAQDFSQRVIRRLAGLVRHVNYWPPGMESPWPPPTNDGVPPRNWLPLFPDEGHWADRHITGVACYRFLVFIERGLNPGDNPSYAGSPP